MHYYQFNIADYRKDTGHLTPVEHYIYRWLIDEYHLSEQPFNNDMNKLLRRMRLDASNRDSLELILDEFFTPACDDDYKPVDLSCHPEYARIGEHPETCQYWIHQRIDKAIDAYSNFIETKSRGGKASAKSRAAKKANESTPVEQPLNTSSTNHKPLTTNHKPLTKGINAEAWGEFEQHRKEMKKPLSELARTKAQNVIKDYTHDQQAEIINKSIQSRWAGLFPEKSYEKNQSTNRPAESHHAGVVRMLRTRIETSNPDT